MSTTTGLLRIASQSPLGQVPRFGRLGRLATALPLLALACNQPSPPTAEGQAQDEDSEGDELGNDESDTPTDSGTGTGTGTGTELPDMPDTDVWEQDLSGTLYPLVDGAHWGYVVTTNTGQIEGMKTLDAVEGTWMGEPAWTLVDDPGAKGNWTESVIIRDQDLTMRVHKETKGPMGITEIVDYDPGFIRANDRWEVVGAKEEFLYERTETDGAGHSPIIEDRGHSYEVLAVETITVPAGTFHTVKIERIRTVGGAAGERAISWFAPSVGKVREVRPADSQIEELVTVTIPGGANLP